MLDILNGRVLRLVLLLLASAGLSFLSQAISADDTVLKRTDPNDLQTSGNVISELWRGGRPQGGFDTWNQQRLQRPRRDIHRNLEKASSTHLGYPTSLRSSFSQGYIDLASRDPVEEGAATLAFVFDTTGSMSDDLLQVIDGAEKILKTVLEKFERPIHNYVLMPFHDPEVGPLTITSDPREFQQSLLDLRPYINSGGDCPEMAVQAIKIALENSLPSSYLYVFTDAHAKDYYRVDEVLRLIQKKQSQVVFVMTGDCGNHSQPGYKAFEAIASTSSGQIFHLNKTDVKEVLNFVQLSLASRKVNLLSLDRESDGPGEESLPLLVDQTIKEFTVSVSGERPKIQIVDPLGEDVTKQEDRVEDLLDLENVKIVGVKEPAPGRYNISVGSDSKYTVRATGLSSINFEHGFSLEPTTNFKETYHRPMKGGTSYVVVKPGDTTEFGDLYRIQMISLDGKILHDLPLTRLPGPEHIFNGTSFVAPEESFHIKIFGRDRSGYQFERISPIAVTSQLPFPPEVTSLTQVHGYFDSPVRISCHVQTLVPFSVSWQKDGVELTPEENFPQSAEVEYTVESPRRDDEGRYTCVARNVAGSASSTIFLDMKEPPPQIAAPANASLAPGRPAALSCDVTSTVAFNLTWSRYIVHGQVEDFFGRIETTGEFVDIEGMTGYRALPNNSLLIEEVSSEDEGWFRCTAANEGGRRAREIHVSVQSPPEISVVPERARFKAGDEISISCISRGFPRPRVEWWKGDVILTGMPGRVTADEGDQVLQISRAQPDDAGQYTCKAYNSAGVEEAHAILAFMEAPRVTVEKEVVLAGNGDTATLLCSIEGTPTPSVKWLKDDVHEVAQLSFIEVTGGTLKILGVQESDAGKYTCQASNAAGTDQADVVLRVGSPPTVVQKPTDTVVEIGTPGGLSCYGVGVPEPTIIWRRSNGHPLPPHFSMDRDGNLRVKAIQVEDEGTYVCTLENQYGKLEMPATLSVSGLLPPLIAAPPDPNIKATLDSPITLPCTVVMGNPIPNILWMHNGEPVTTQKGSIVKPDGSLKIFSVATKHEGDYDCVATNVAGNSTQTLHLTIMIPPRAKSKRLEEKLIALEGDNAKLKCPVKANPRPAFFWQKNGQSISNTNTRMRILPDGILVIRRLTKEDAGTYVCTAVNLAGAAKIPVVLEIHVPPSIEDDPETYTVSEGEVVEIPCDASGTPLPIITWIRFDQTIMYDNTLPDGTLRLVATAENEGRYECLVTNDAGSAKRPVTVVITKIPEISPPGDETLTVNEGQDLKLPCEVRGHPPPEVVWRTKGFEVEPNQHLIPMAGYLMMRDVTRDLTGRYTCIATNRAGEASKTFVINVNYPPSPEVNNPEGEKLSVVEGGRLILPCPAKANPTPTREWTKDGHLLVAKDNVKIQEDGERVEIYRAGLPDNGNYTCTISNILGYTDINYSVQVLIPPKVSSTKVSSVPVVIEGESVRINCPVDAVPLPTITWLKDGISIFSTKDRADMTHIVIEDSGQTLHILEATADDQGIYRCVATNDAGETDLLFPLEVLVAPQFNQYFHQPNVVLNIGDTLDLDCEASGDPEPQVSWILDGLPMYAHVTPGGRRVFIPRVRLGDAGHYMCNATNTAGSTHRNFTVTVLMAPVVDETGGVGVGGGGGGGASGGNSGAVEAVAGGDAQLWCRTTGSPVPSVTWTKEQRELSTIAELDHSIEENGQLLKLRSVDHSTSGVYLCNATNSVGTATKQFNFTVMIPPKISGWGDSDGDTVNEIEVIAGKDVILFCPVEGNPKPSITWLRDGQALSAHPRIHLTSPNELLLTNSQAADSGNYACLATNRAGADEKQFEVQVIVPAKINLGVPTGRAPDTPPSQEVLVDMPFSLYCPAEGFPHPHITWTKDGSPLQGLLGTGLDGRVEAGDSGRRLMVSGAVVSDSGTYTCLAENQGGSDSVYYNVTVLVPPMIRQDTETFHSSIEGENVTLRCEVEGDPPPAIVWLLDGLDLLALGLPGLTVERQGTHASVIQISPVSEQHTGMFTCIASSMAGSDELNYNVKVATPPKITDDIASRDIVVRVNRPATLTCHVESTPKPQIFWFKNGSPIDEMDANIHLSTSGRDLKILQVTEVDSANYSCLAINEAGATSINFTLEVHVPPRLTATVDETVHVVAGEDTELFCPVQATPTPSILWMKDAAILQHTFTSEDPRRLLLNDVTKDDDGRYTCLATNEAGTTEQDFMLRVMVPPRLLDLDTPVMEKTVVLNRAVTITCFITADPPPVITWLKDGRNLTTIESGVTVDNKGRRVNVARARSINAGNYTCLAANAAGTTALTTLLTVLTPPAWNEEAEFEPEVVGVAGEELHLYCDVEGTPPPSILWLKDGQVITNISEEVMIEEKDKLLRILSVDGEDGGRYTCITSNAAGTNEYDFEVTVLATPTLTYQPKTEHTVLVNRAVSLECPVEGSPEPEIEWIVDGRTVGESEHFMRLTGTRRQLHILRVLGSSTGEVSCVATNAVGELTTNYTLNVLSPPTITPVPPTRKARVQEGDALTLSCKTKGTPKPQVAWVAAGGKLLTERELYAGGLELQDEGESIVILDANGEHQGKYTCIASNDAGSVEENFDVQVLLPPFITEPEEGTQIEAVQGTSVSLFCIVDARPPAAISWLKNGSPLEVRRDPFVHITSGGEHLSFLRVLPHHTDNYTCVASSAAGEDSLTYSLQVMVPPVIIEDMVENSVGGGLGGETMGIVGGEVDLECYTLGTPTPVLTWTKNEEVIETDDRILLLEENQVLRLTAAQKEDSGRYTCTATSPSGSASRDFVVIIHSPPRIIPPLDTNVEVIVNQPLVLSCEAESSLEAAASWTRHGRPILHYSDPNLQVRKNGEELHILRVREADGGPFTCVAINTAGHDTLTYTLTVQVPAVIERANLRQQVTAIEGQHIDLTCDASGSPTPSVSWYKGTTLITPEHPHFKIQNEGEKIQILSVKKTDEGFISCSAENPAGKDSVNFTIQVLVSPVINTEAKTEVSVMEGESVVLECPVNAHPEPTIIWTVEGVVVGVGGRGNIDVVGDGRTLRIAHVGSDNSGVYTCTATNAAGITDIPITLVVLVPPQIEGGERSGHQREGEEELITVMEGGHASLDCHLVKGSPKPTRKWLVGPDLIEPMHPAINDGEKLLITRSAVTDAAQYRCVAENSAGTDKKIVRVVVNAPPRVNTTALLGPFKVSSPGGADATLLPPDGRPHHSSVSTSVTTTEDQTISIPCPVTGFPKPRRLWYRGSQSLVSSVRMNVGVSGQNLTIVGVTPRDAGDYVCVAVNPAGETQLTTTLDVIGRPVLEGEPEEDVMVVKGQRVILQCKVKRPSVSTLEGGPRHVEYNITWKKDGRVLQFRGRELPSVTQLEHETPTRLMGERTDSSYYSNDYLGSDYFSDYLGEYSYPEGDKPEGGPSGLNPFNYFNNILDNNIFSRAEGGNFSQSEVQNGSLREVNSEGNDLNLESLTPSTSPSPAISVSSSPSSWYEMSNDLSQFTLPKVSMKEEGLYTCEVTNEAGVSKRTFKVDTLVPPDIDGIQEVKIHEAAIGEPVVFECDAIGDPPPQVTWYRGAKQVKPHSRLQLLEDDHVLIITSIQENDGGEYTCLATNLAGITEETFHLQVLVPPKMAGTEEPSSFQVISGRSVKLECQVEGGFPTPEVVWRFKDEVVVPGSNFYIQDHDLIIDRVTVDLAGQYQCEASNSVGKATKRFNVDVTEAPFIAGGSSVETVTVVEGETAEFNCLASGQPEPIMFWFKEGSGIRIDDNVGVSVGGKTLRIDVVDRDDSGIYTCFASNLAGNHSKDYFLQVLQPPQLLDAPDEILAVSGEMVNLICSFTGFPNPTIRWYFEGTPLPPTEDSLVPSGGLQVSPVRPEHVGNYTCVAENEAGKANHTFPLTVQTPPEVEVGKETVVVVSGESATLYCYASGSPTPTITWLKAHQVISPGPEFEFKSPGTLHLPKVTPDLADTYICTARSPAGVAHAYTALVVQESPSVSAGQEEVVGIVGKEVRLRCQVSGTPIPVITWARPDRGGQSVTPEDPRVQLLGSSLVILPVAVEDMGRYECTARNPAGRSTAEVLLTVHSPPTVEEDLAEAVSVVRGEELTLGCTASGYPTPQTRWLREGRIVSETQRLKLPTNGELVISSIQASDSGLYTCLASNAAGRLYREVVVVVQVPPRMTVLPRTQEVTRGDRLELECEAAGVPVPSIRWLLNGTKVTGVSTSSGGHGTLVVERASKTDEGTYTCIAENEAGHRKAVAGVRVKVPPVIMYAPEEMTVLELNAVTLTCVAEGDPAPATTWIKEGHSVHSSDRVHLMENGSLVIDSLQASDAGEYKCVVSNDAGAAEATAHLVVHTPPVLTRPPVSAVVEVGGTIVFDCEAEGSPVPTIQWGVTPGELHSRYLHLTNGSLQLIAAQMEDEGQVICQAYNDLGEDLAKADLSIRVNGMWGSWGPWSSCSVSCGKGQQERRRACDSPAPRHGGAPCKGDDANDRSETHSRPHDIHTRPCRPQPCPVDGNWSPWDPWSECSVTCGSGVRLRTRYCTAPAPLYGGRPCIGQTVEEEPCKLRDCPVSGGWGEWSPWSECSTTCQQGLRQRTRLCDSPTPAAGGAYCQGDDLEVTPCSNAPCLLDGNWGSWESWSVCSASCGGGVRRRQRQCDDPPPSNGGRFCPGSDTLEDYCNLEMCPVNGGWSSWSAWGSCTATCGGGQRRRFRSCDNPAPSQDGRACTGPDTDTEACNSHKCPVSGSWGSWGEWSPCSMTCGIGVRVRTRRCNAPYPRFGGAPCPGEDRETATCEGSTCEVLPVVARGTLMGELNGEDLGIVTLVANVSTLGMQRTVTANISPLIPKHGTWITPLLSVLSPVYWTAAYEVNGAVNGHTLTKGFFRREAHVAFATGETVDMTHVVRGVDSSGTLLVDVVVTGQVPYLPPGSQITLQPYTEDYVQTGGGSLFATSTRTFSVGDYLLPYAWNQTVSYDAELGNMPFLVETLHANGIGASYSNTQGELNLIVSTSIAPGSPNGTCPSGFTLEASGPFCRDNDECLESTSRCSHGCANTLGSYACTCTEGYTLGPDGYTCQDVNECEMPGVCGPREQCDNTAGSYTCTYTCAEGFRRTSSGTSCEDINECQEEPKVCDQTCLNLIGGYRCDCRRGFRLVGQNECVDIDECAQFRSPCSHGCENTIGSFKCACPEGHTLLPNGRCKDINECAIHSHDCLDEQECQNTEGSYRCITHCPPGLKQSGNGTCTDIDECAEQVSGCHYTQLCSNTWGSYRCSCSRGFRSSGPGLPCLDVNECLSTPSPCSYRCRNLRGSYECICAPGQKRLPDGKSCVGLQYVEEPRARSSFPRRARPAPSGYPTSEFQEQLLHQFYAEMSCPKGFVFEDNECKDVNECALPERCQHRCENTNGSYMCLCPPGYRLNFNQRTCDDIDECVEQNVQCGRDKLCFNLRGSYKCIPAPCPPDYQRDPLTGSCILDCTRGHSSCPPGVSYAHILAFKTASLPAGIHAHQDLVRLMAYDQAGNLVPQTLFTIIENDTGIQFRIRPENGKGILRTLQPLTAGREYRMVVEAVSYDEFERFVKYSTRFIIFLHISEYPY
ncbi:hemicentin-1-like isoform X1 [Macrobrachium rosenbergii]|uniref:hemicentin-1-like isoform X1 n=1 Tax=Macrobrachium rosenbergii TaxID=79674 RepID=UPI0034D543BD